MTEFKENHLNVVNRGELEDITKPASKHGKTGSRVVSGSHKENNVASASSQRFKSGTSLAPSLELLTPEEVMSRSYDLELEDLGSSEYATDDEDDNQTTAINTGRTSSIFNIAEPLTDREKKQQQMMRAEWSDDDDDDYLAARQLSLFADESEQDYEVDSDEERDIIKEIKEEITKQVRTEMAGELEVYKQAQEKLRRADEEDPNADLNELEPKLREAIIKMRKLDKILAKKIKKEKRVKRDRILLQKKLREELDELKIGPKKITADEKKNTERFLALELPPSHNEGINLSEPMEDEIPGTPLFQTQVPDAGLNNQSTTDDFKAQDNSSRESVAPGSSLADESIISGSTTSQSSTGKQRKRKNKDFIRRNKELASDAQNAIAMTDDEKKRVEDLLKNVDELSDIPEEGSCNGSEIADTPNPFQVALVQGEGYLPEDEDFRRLEAIDSRLKMLLPPEDFESIASGSRMGISESRQTMLFTRTLVKSSMDTEGSHLGEIALQETKEDRDVKQRLKEIESDLNQLSSAVDAEIESPTLSEAQLQDLLDDCARTMSRATQETDSLALSTSRSSTHSRASIMENPPKLSDEVLQELLADARKSGIGSSASHHQPIDDSSHNEENLVLESVSEDTIKELLRDSRATSRNSTHNGSSSKPQTPLQRPKHANTYYQNNTLQDGIPEPRKCFLPEIDPKGTLTQRSNSQRLNNEEYPSSRPSSGLTSAVIVRNSLAESSSLSLGSESGQTPHPPNEGRKSSGGRNRTISPFTKNNFEH